MYIDVQKFRLHFYVQAYERILVGHGERFIPILNGFIDNFALNIPAVYKITLIIPVPAGDKWFSHIPVHTDRRPL